MMKLRKRLTNCCTTKHMQISIDFDEHQRERMITYDGLESCILKSNSLGVESSASREDAFATGCSDAACTSSSSGRDPSFSSSQWTTKKKDDQESNEQNMCRKPRPYVKQRPGYVLQSSDIDGMREVFTKLLLGEDVTGGRKGVTSARALSNAITNLGASVFGELWKLEPLPDEMKAKWRKEMDWLLSPANYMVELVPAKRNDPNGRTFEIMTPKARADIHLNLPALQKLDSMLIDILDSMVKTEFWYSNSSPLSEGKDRIAMESNSWWLPFPRIPKDGLSDNAQKKLLCQGTLVHQVFKAAKSINEDVLHEMLVPGVLKDSLPRSVKCCLGEELFKRLSRESSSTTEMANSLILKSDHEVLDTINKLEAAALVMTDRISEEEPSKSPAWSWPFLKDSVSELEKMESLLLPVEALLRELKMRFPYLPHSFLDVMKVQHCKDVGHSILEAYSRFLASLAYNMLSRIAAILKEDHSCTPDSPLAVCSFHVLSSRRIVESPLVDSSMKKVDKADWQFSYSDRSRSDSEMFSPCTSESKSSSTTTETPGGSCVWFSAEHGSPKLSP